MAAVDSKTETRSSAATVCSIRAKQRPGASIITEALVQNVHFNETTATGVKGITGGGAHTTEAKKEVILSCGALNTPKILELSGIGNKEILNRYRISVAVVGNSNIGENRQDHLMTGISFEVVDWVITGDALMRQEPETMQEATKLCYEHNAGPLTIRSVQSTAFMPCLDENAIRHIFEQPDSPTWAQFMFICQANLHETGTTFVGQKLLPGNSISLGVVQGIPFSRGSVHTSSAKVEYKPTVDPRYLSHPLDLDIIARNLLDVEKLHKSAKQYLRDTATTTYRPCDTAAMLPREQGGVVVEKLRVHGTTNLRVCDASILPLITVGNIMSTVYAVAERAAEIIKAEA
ncbi:hypothetical protein BDV24DRAFT_161468 [Aspergillus arachidicola]|uniref:Glucose-methanol-choline oxidoreductase N-terminal domain-containing protein n=1 Tax=Aspergillus arachidicola TaxID=656916 RepID=A0A5N6YD67_9EURO|nr:hypothetical protein BDV24DRAFT_161468 [Aspergillus arachidicola]